MKIFDDDQIFEFHRPLDTFWLPDPDIGFVPRQEYVDFLHQQPRVIANLSTEHWGDHDYPMCRYMHDVMHDHANCVILSHNPDHDGLAHNIMFFPFWLGHTRNLSKKIPSLVSPNKKSRYLSCVNFRARPHRVRICRLLIDTNLDQSAHLTLPFGEMHQELADADDDRFWQSISNRHERPWNFSPFDTNWLPYQDSWLNVVTETSPQDGIFITEKTWKCISIGQLFVIVGGRGSVAHLRNLGFDTFDDIIPHHKYDDLPGYAARCDAVIDILRSLQDLDWLEVYQTTHQRRLANQLRFFSDSAYDPYIQRLREFFKL